MRIAFVNLSIEPYPPSDAQAISTCIQQTARALRDAGHDVSIYSRLSGAAVAERDVHGIPDAPVSQMRIVKKARHLGARFKGLDWPGQAQYLRAVRRAIARTSSPPDLLIAANEFHVADMLSKLYPDGRVVLWLHNEQLTNHKAQQSLFERLASVVTVSTYIGKWVLGAFPIGQEKVEVVHNGVNADQFYPRKNFLMPTECPRVLFVGRIDEGKSPDVLLSALRGLMAKGLSATVTLVGGQQRFKDDGAVAATYVRDVMRDLDRLGGTYLGPVARFALPQVMREHDIVCIPSRVNEAFSLVALEAMASGCAVVASDRGGLPEACGGSAIHVDPDDTNALHNALGSLLGDEQQLLSYKGRAVEHARRKTWAATAEGLVRAGSLERCNG